MCGPSTQIILEAPHDTPDGFWRGAGLDLKNMTNSKVWQAIYPLHELGEKDKVHEQWGTWRPHVDLTQERATCPCLFGASSAEEKEKPYRFTTPRLDLLKEYFGEKVAMYFAFVQHFTTWMIVPAVLGIIVGVHAYVNQTNSRRDLRTMFNETLGGNCMSGWEDRRSGTATMVEAQIFSGYVYILN